MSFAHYFSCISSSAVTTCADVQSLNPNHVDGEYWLYPPAFNGTRVKVYCHAMNSTPGEYITLATPYFMNAPELTTPSCSNENVYQYSSLGISIYSKFGIEINVTMFSIYNGSGNDLL